MRDREEQIREDLALRAADHQRTFDLERRVLTSYGEWIGALAPWSHFVTLTHDPKRLPSGHTIVGLSLHRDKVNGWVQSDLRHYAPGCSWWSETELHASGQAHEHGLLAVPAGSPAAILSARTRWYERAGYAYFRPIENVQAAAEYVAKYTGKAAASAPIVFGRAVWDRRLFVAGLVLAARAEHA